MKNRFWTAVAVFGVLLAAMTPAASAAPGEANHGGSAGKGQRIKSSHNDVSPPLRTVRPVVEPHSGPPKAQEDRPQQVSLPGHSDKGDPVVQTKGKENEPAPAGPTNAPTQEAPASGTTWQGLSYNSSNCGCLPPDPNGAIGPNDYIQIVNTGFQIFSRTGTSLYGPANINAIWKGFGGQCEADNDGDPIVFYDQMADRWVISQFTATDIPYDECIAVSKTGDPTGQWNRYAFPLSTNTDFPDYPKFGVWPDGYYLSDNWFTGTGGNTYAGPRPFVFDRLKMLAGLPASYQTFDALGASEPPLLPATLDGPTLPPAGAPNSFVGMGSDSNSNDALEIFHFHVDWNNSANTTFLQSATLPVAGWTQICPNTDACLAQPGTSQKLDAIGDRIMYRLAYRNFGDHEAMVVNQTVKVATGPIAGIRWYEIDNPSTTPTLAQQSTYAPGTASRWMGSMAMDHNADIGLGYSAVNTTSGSSFAPSIKFTGRLALDPSNTLQSEATLFAGTTVQGSCSGCNRWGDYSALSVDPLDDCTFYYTQEYTGSGGTYHWSTKVGTFSFPSCTPAITPSLLLNGSSDTGTSSVDGITDDATPTLQGRVTQGNTVSVYDGPTLLGTAVADGTNSWSYTPSTQLGDGPHTITASVTDGDSVTRSSSPLAITVDTATPTVSIDSYGQGVSGPSSETFSFSSSKSGSTFVCSLDGATATACTSPQAYSNLSKSNHTFTVMATDLAGNTSDPVEQDWSNTTVPGIPRNLVATPANGQATIAWAAPLDNGGSVIDNYDVQLTGQSVVHVDPTGAGCTGTGTAQTCSITISPLTNGTLYSVSVTPHNNIGFGTAATGSVTPSPVNQPPTLSLPGDQGVAYRGTLNFDVTANDPDLGDAVTLGATGLPAGLSTSVSGRTITVSGTVTAAPGNYNVTFTANDGHNAAVSQGLQITVTRATVSVQPDSINPYTVKIASTSTTSPAIQLGAVITGVPTSEASKMRVTLGLYPAGGAAGTACNLTPTASTSGTIQGRCTLTGRAQNVYRVAISVGGTYYTGSAPTGIMTAYKPSLGGHGGAGILARSDEAGTPAANFGFLARRSNGQVLGTVYYIEHRSGGDVTVRTTSLTSLTVSGNTATVGGPALLNAVSGYTLTFKATGNGTVNTGSVGLTLVDSSLTIVPDLNFSPINITAGKVMVPLTTTKA